MRIKAGCTLGLLASAFAVVGFPGRAQDTASASAEGNVRVIQIQAKKFEFEPSEITLKKDQPVTLELTSKDVECRDSGFTEC